MRAMKFSIRDMLWLTVVVALVLGLIFVKQPSAPGRYQLIADPHQSGARYMVDTTTGDYWYQLSNKWHEGTSPIPKDR
jgi:hypothetical protein